MVARIRQPLIELGIPVAIDPERGRKLRPANVEIVFDVVQDLPLEEDHEGYARNRNGGEDGGRRNAENPQPDRVGPHGAWRSGLAILVSRIGFPLIAAGFPGYSRGRA